MSNYTRMSNDNLVKELVSRDEAIKDMGRRFADAKRELQRKNKDLKEALEKRVGKSGRDMESLILKNKQLETEIKEQTDLRLYETRNLNYEISELKKDNNHEENSLQRLRLQNTKLEKEITHLKKLQKEMDEQYKGLEEKCNSQSVPDGFADKDEEIHSSELYQILKQNHDALNETVNKCHGEIDELEDKVDMQKKSIKTLTELNSELLDKIKDYKELNSVLTETVAMQAVKINTGKDLREDND